MERNLKRYRDALGPYLIEARIGRGGMGVVYRARHHLTRESAAVKTVNVRSAEHLAAFRREVQVLAELRHPGIVRILDHGIDGGMPWYAMELVQGQPLASLLQSELATETAALSTVDHGTIAITADNETHAASSTRLRSAKVRPLRKLPPLPELLRVVRKVCSALAFLHSHGLVHRDVKPDNIMIQASGEPILVDFGIVGQFRDSQGREVLTLQRSAGTLAYMSPEQASASFIDARADLFSLGCILYECVAGRLPFGPAGLYDLALPDPPRPSSLVDGVPPELDALVMGLLAKDARHRVGYAEDVAAVLDRLIEEERPSEPPKSEPPYLYRPDFAGHDELLERLSRFLRGDREPSAAITLISGESGLGKTRLLLELGARAVASGMTVITGQCLPVGATSVDFGARAESLHPLRSFLLNVADACRAGGRDVTERLLGNRGAVLAAFEPALSAVLTDAEQELLPVSPEQARSRLFATLEATLEAVARDHPLSLLLLIDDLQWADSLSLEFLAYLAESSRHYGFRIIATYRDEEVSDELSALIALPNVPCEHLTRFDRHATKSMVSGMLALTDPPEEWVEFLEEASGGNPFFIAEYLRAAISERLLKRSHSGRWLLESAGEGATLRDRLGLPATIGALVSRRLNGLDEHARSALQAAAVLGRSFDIDLLAEIAELDAHVTRTAYARLRQRQILDSDSTRNRAFVHDKLREITYGWIDHDRRKRLHARAAAALSARRDGGHADVELGSLGYHYAQAGSPLDAARYFELAGARAHAQYANRDAERFYRLALFEHERAGEANDTDHEATSRLRQALAEVLMLSSGFGEARAALERAIAETAADRRVDRARRRRLLARTWERQHQHENALQAYAQAELELGERPPSSESAAEFWFERVQIQIQSSWSLYFLSRVDELAERIERIRPLIEEQGTPVQRAQFFQALAHMNVRRARYRISEDTLEYVHASLRAAEQQTDPTELALAHFSTAFPLMFAGRDVEAEPHYAKAIELAERVGDVMLQARFLSYAAICQRRLGRTSETRAFAQRALDIAEKQRLYDYVGVAHANLCWVAFRCGDDAEAPAAQALGAWKNLPPGYPYPLQWLARIPLAVQLFRRGRTSEALQHWRFLLAPTQYALPERLSDVILGGLDREAEPSRLHETLVSLERLSHNFALL